MKHAPLFTRIPLLFFYVLLALGLSCVDHDMPPADLPESACLTTSGTPRTYPCEFIIEKLSFLSKDGSVLAEVTQGSPNAVLSRSGAKSDSNPGAVAIGSTGSMVFDVRATVKRVARPSFPTTVGYLLSATTNSARERILHTPGERYSIGAPVALDMPVGDSRNLTFELMYLYQLANVGGVVRPTPFGPSTNMVFIENDNTTLQFNRSMPPYTFVGSVVEDFIRINAGIAP